MDVAELIKVRLDQLGYDQRRLAVAVQVTQSFISQLLNRKKKPPSPERTDIYDRMERFLKIPKGDLSKLARLQRNQELKDRLDPAARPLFREVRDLILDKCAREKVPLIRQIFEREPLGEVERFVTQKLVDVVQGIAKDKWKDESWIRNLARLHKKSYEEVRVSVLEILEADIFNLATSSSLDLLRGLVVSWDLDLATFNLTVALRPAAGAQRVRQFAHVEVKERDFLVDEPGLSQFLKDPLLSGGIRDAEIEALRSLKIEGKKPNALFYYRTLQNLRDPLHFLERALPHSDGVGDAVVKSRR